MRGLEEGGGLAGTVRPELGTGVSVTVVRGGSCPAISLKAFFPPLFPPSNLLICITKRTGAVSLVSCGGKKKIISTTRVAMG